MDFHETCGGKLLFFSEMLNEVTLEHRSTHFQLLSPNNQKIKIQYLYPDYQINSIEHIVCFFFVFYVDETIGVYFS